MRAAERPGDPCPFTTEDALSIASEQLADLYGVRDVTEGDTDMPPAEFVSAVETYLQASQSDDPGHAGLLFYVSQADDVCLLFARATDRLNTGNPDHPTYLAFDLVAVPGTPAKIKEITDKLLVQLLTGKSQARDPKPKSEFAREQSRSAEPLSAASSPVSSGHVLAELSRLLLPGRFSPEIERLTGLTIVPALNIGRVPFGALDPDNDGVPLMDRMPINVESSLVSIFKQRVFGWTLPGISTPVVLGDPDATDDPDWVLPRLPGAAREAGEIAARVHAMPLIGRNATPERLVSAAGKADYIHIAAHGIASAVDPMDGSFLALSGARLTARQIQNLKLEGGPVVVLSACQSALGGPLEAGIIGVARGFVLAGATVVVASLWNVDDEATAWIMARFVENLEKADPANALRLAQIEARGKWPSPQVWAAFITYGSRIVPPAN